MSEETKPQPGKGDTSFKSEQEKAKWRDEAYKAAQKQLQDDERFQLYAKDFSAHSVKHFIEDFASRKTRWMEWGEKYAKWKETDDLAWSEKAAELLKHIQQKKLFDLQCQWRAEKIHLPQVSVCYDFFYWSAHIFTCPFLPHVEEDEMMLYLDYLKSSNYEFRQGLHAWQHYDQIKEAYENNNADYQFPEWYDFYNSRKGTGVYLSLPDIRGPKEKFYIELYEENERKNKKPEKNNTVPAPAPVASAKRPLNYSRDGFMDWFIKTFDTPQTYTYYKALTTPGKNQDERVHEAVHMLSQAEKTYPIKKANDWKEGLFATAGEFYKEKMIYFLPIAFEEYKMFIEYSIENAAVIDFLAAFDTFNRDVEKHKILKGRVLNGEPENFDF